MGLSDEVAESDLQLAKQPPSLTQDPSRESSPPLDMLASLADHRYQRDFKH
jgi:hypothetical protein